MAGQCTFVAGEIPNKEKDASGDEELKQQLKEMNEKMSNLEYALGEITRPYGNLMENMERLRSITEGYFRIIDLYRKHGKVSPDLLLPEVKDPISREIVNILFEKPDLNVSQIAEILKERRGTASRKTVRDKLAFLEEIGAIIVLDDKKIKRYAVSDDMQERWLKVLGLKH